MLKADKIESLPAGSWHRMLCSSQASWAIGTGVCDMGGFTSVAQPRHRDCNHGMDGNLPRYAKMTAPIVGQLGCLVPAIHLLSMLIPDMTNDSIEEIFQGPSVRMTRRVNFFHNQFCRPIAVLIDLEGASMDNSLAPLSWLKRGLCLQIWCRRAG